jgi:dTMP kinase
MRPRDAADRYRSLLANREFRLWFTSSLGSSIGDWVGLFALQVLVISLAEPGDPVALFGLGGIMVARVLPSVLFGPFAGVLADRLDRKRLMVAADVARAGLFVVVAFTRDLWLLLALVFVVECFSLLYIGAKNALLPTLVEDDELAEANQLTLLITYGPLPFGAAVAVLLGWLGTALDAVGLPRVEPTVAALLLNAATFALAGAIIAFLRPPADARREEPEGRDSPLAELRDGVAFIWEQRTMRSLMVGVFGVFFGTGALVALGPEFVRSVLERPEADWYGLMTTVGFGLLAGMLVAPTASAHLGIERMFPVTMVAAAVLAMVIAVLPVFWVIQASGFGLGAFAGAGLVLGYTLLHERTTDAVRGRVFTVLYTGTRITMFAALAIGPFAAVAVGIRPVLFTGGGVALGAAVWATAGMVTSSRAER